VLAERRGRRSVTGDCARTPWRHRSCRWRAAPRRTENRFGQRPACASAEPPPSRSLIACSGLRSRSCLRPATRKRCRVRRHDHGRPCYAARSAPLGAGGDQGEAAAKVPSLEDARRALALGDFESADVSARALRKRTLPPVEVFLFGSQRVCHAIRWAGRAW
jgi:hypothetical protein